MVVSSGEGAAGMKKRRIGERGRICRGEEQKKEKGGEAVIIHSSIRG